MEWKAKDINIYQEEKEYIDTAVVPLVPVALGGKMKQTVEKGEFIQLLSLHLERQFKGRMLFFPAFTYLSDTDDSHQAENLKQWEETIKNNGFKYLFYLTSDPLWRNIGNIAADSLLFVPSVPLEHMDEQYKQSIMEDQVKQLMKEIVQGWQSAN